MRLPRSHSATPAEAGKSFRGEITTPTLELNHKRGAEKSLVCGSEIVGISSFQRDLMWKCEPDLRNHANRMFLGVVAQFGANMKNVGYGVFAAPACFKSGAMVIEGNLRREIEGHVELAKVL